MSAPTVTVIGTVSPLVEGYFLAELSQAVNLTDVTCPSVIWKTLPSPIRGVINTDGRLMAFGATNPTSNPFILPPTKGTLVTPSYGAFMTLRIVTTNDDLTTKSKENWELDSSISTVEISSIAVIASLPVNFFMHNQMAGLAEDDHPQYGFASSLAAVNSIAAGAVVSSVLQFLSPDTQLWGITISNSGIMQANTL